MSPQPTKFDAVVSWLGFGVGNLGFLVQVAGLAITFVFDRPIIGYQCLTAGFWIAGLGGAGIAYGLQVDAGGSVKQQGGPWTYEPPKSRWPAAVWSIGLFPVWAVLSLPLGILIYGGLILGGVGYGIWGAWRLVRLLCPSPRSA